MRDKVLIATLLRPNGETGVQTHFNVFLNYLAAKGLSCEVVTPFSMAGVLHYTIFGLRRLIDPVSGAVSVWWYRHWHYIYLRSALKRALFDGEPKVVYAQCPLSAKAALEARQNSRQRVVMVVHYNVSQAEEWAEKAKIKRGCILFNRIKKIESDLLPKLDGIVYVSDFMRKEIEANHPHLSHNRSCVIPNFVADRLVDGSPSMGCGDLISVGTLEPRKNQSFLLAVIAAAEKRGRRYSLTLVGDGPDKGKLVTLARKFKIENRVFFLGFVPDAWRLMAGHKAYVHAATIENLPITLIEAMSANLPIFASPVGGVPEVFEDGRHGRYWDLADAGSAAEVLISTIENDDLFARLTLGARKQFEEKFELNVVASTLYNFLCDETCVVGPVDAGMADNPSRNAHPIRE